MDAEGSLSKTDRLRAKCTTQPGGYLQRYHPVGKQDLDITKDRTGTWPYLLFMH